MTKNGFKTTLLQLAFVLAVILAGFFYTIPVGYAADINWSIGGTASKGTGTLLDESGHADVTTINDNNESTYHGKGGASGGSGGGSAEDIITFSTSANSITSVSLVSESGGTQGGMASCKIYLYYGGAWNLVYTIWDGPGALVWATRTNTLAGSWSNVTAIKVAITVAFRAGSGFGRFYELRAWGPSNVIIPTVTTSAATSILSSSATLNRNITATGGENVLERGFDWGTSSGSYPNSWTESGSFGTGGFSHPITGLNQQTTYYFRAKARNSAGWSYGSELSFTTLTAYIDCGLRIHDGTAVRTIACEPVGTLTSALRIRKNTTTYGIILVSTGDANASKIRIQTGSGVKALRKL